MDYLTAAFQEGLEDGMEKSAMAKVVGGVLRRGAFRTARKTRGAIKKPAALSDVVSGRQPLVQTMSQSRARRAKALSKAREKMKARYNTTRWKSGGNRRG